MSREMTPAEVREVQLDALVAFDGWCRDHRLSYQLAFGTLLGAVRHGGFIPWDDDLDVAMPRRDYEQFCRDFLRNPPTPLTVGSLATDAGWPLPFAKVWDTRTSVREHTHLRLHAGVGLDVFPIDDVPASGWRRAWQLRLSAFISRLESLAAIKHRPGRDRRKTLILEVAGPAARRLGPARIAALRDRVAAAWNGRGGEASVIVGPYSWTTPRHGFIETTAIQFEGFNAPAPRDTDAVLSAIYGDYMTPPPTNRRVTHHVATKSWV